MRLAQSLRSIVAEAETPRGALYSTVRPDPEGVVRWREALLGIAERLERPAPMNPRGVARVTLLLTEGTGPLYTSDPSCSLGDAVWWIADGFQPCPPHAWDSPVIMKVDPEHVAWTCRRCGAIAMSDDPAVRPA
jgi:hypothetical protein